MSLGGPRLDRPSAIGDEGRPRAASLWVATLAVLALAVAVGFSVDDPTMVTAVATVVGLAVAGIALLERERFGRLFVGHALVAAFGSTFALFVVVGPFLGRVGLALAGVAVGLFGVAMTWADVDAAGLRRGAVGAALTAASLFVFGALATIGAGIVGLAVGLLRSIVATTAPAPSLAGVLGVIAGVGVGLSIALRLLPVRALTPRSRRPAVDRRLDGLFRALRFATVASLAALFLTALAWLAGAFDGLRTSMPALARLLAALSSAAVVRPLVATAVLAVLAGLAAGGLRSVTRRLGPARTRQTAAIAVGVALVGLAAVAVALVAAGAALGNPAPFWALVTVGPPAAVVFGLGPLAFLLVVGTILLATALGIVPERTTGPALSAAGLVVTAVGLGSTAPTLAFAALGGALVVWDASTFGLGLTAELGHLPRTRRLELVHGVLSVCVAVGAVALAAGLEGLRTTLFAGVGAPGALVVAGIGAVLLLVPLRG